MHTRSAVLSCDSCNFYCVFFAETIRSIGGFPPVLNHHSFTWPWSRHLGKALVSNTSSEANLRVHPWQSTKGKNRQYTIHTGMLTGIPTMFQYLSHICCILLLNHFCTFLLFCLSKYLHFQQKSQPWMDSPLNSPPISRQDTTPGVSAGSPSPPSPVEEVTEAWISCRFLRRQFLEGVEELAGNALFNLYVYNRYKNIYLYNYICIIFPHTNKVTVQFK